MSATARNIGNKALEQDFALLRALIRQAPLHWLAIQTNPRCEERAALGLRSKGFVTYLPMVPDTRKAGRSKCEIDASRPMFARYVFVGNNPNSWISTDEIRSCDGVEGILTFRADQGLHRIPAHQIGIIAEAAQQAQLGKKSVVGHGFEIGDGIVIVSGALNHFKGKIHDLNEKQGTARVDLKLFGGDAPATVSLDNIDLL